MTNKLIIALRGDLVRQWRYQLIGAAVLVTALYSLILIPMKQHELDKAMLFLIFSDPVALGMLFIGSLILFERTDRTLEAIVITPLKRWQYLWSKALSLTLIALACSVAMALVGFGWRVNWFWYLVGIALSSFIFVFLGFAIVTTCRTFNQYIMKMGIYLIPVALPLLNYAGVTDTKLWYIIPTQATLILMNTIVEAQLVGDIIYAVLYLLLWCVGSFYFAMRAFDHYLSR